MNIVPYEQPVERPRRVKLSRLKGWRLPPNTVVVARPSPWGNPFKIDEYVSGEGGRLVAERVQTAADAVRMFRSMIDGLSTIDRSTFMRKLEQLRGKNLACWCDLDAPCHADVLLELANP